MNRSFKVLCITLSLLLTHRLSAQAPQSGPLATAIKLDTLDPAAFAQWSDGTEKPLALKDGPRHVLWTASTPPEWDGVRFGESKMPGPRHLRIGFKSPVTVGCVLVRAGGQVSALKADADYPGNLADAAAWIPARRIAGGAVVDTEGTSESYALWVFPHTVSTRALRFTHTARPTDMDYAGWLGGAYVLAQRMVNVAPQAFVSASARNEAAGRIIDEDNNKMWHAWDNGDKGGELPVSAEHPVEVLLVWPRPMPVRGLAALWAGFEAADVQVFQGESGRAPHEATEAEWSAAAHWQRLENQYPRGLGVNWYDLGRTATTRAVRLRITHATRESHGHLQGKTNEGRRVWLGELLALRPLGDAPLESALPAAAAASATVKPPIPVRFKLDAPGYVTLVIDDANGRRVRNLVSETGFPAGENTAWWDGTDDLRRDVDAARHGVYHIPAELVAPGEYRVHGLYHAGIDLRYEFSVYNGGNPAWPTADHTGGWLTNHTPPSSALFVPGDRAPGGEPLVYLGSYVSEGGDGLAWVDLDGHKRGGVGWVGGAWTGAPYLAYDAGTKAERDVHVYVGSAWEGELRLTAVTAKGDRAVVKYSLSGGKKGSVITGLAIHDGLLACSLPKQGQLLLVDAKAGKVLGTVPLADPRGLAFDATGRLLALVGKQLQRYNSPRPPAVLGRMGEGQGVRAAEAASDSASPRSPHLSPPETLVATGLEDPQHVTCDAKGNLYITDRGASHQVKVFNPAGKPLRTIGTPGVPQAGPYDPQHMNNPNGLTIDSRGQLWVAETDFQPKRVSVWTLDGRLIKAYYGPSEYGGGGALDPRDKTRFYYHGMEFALDWQRGVDRLARVLFRPGPEQLGLPAGHFADGQPETAIYRATAAGTLRYFSNCYDSNPTNGAPLVMLWLDRQGIAVPVAALGRAHDWPLLLEERFKSRWPAGVDPHGDEWRNPVMVAWSDLNGDGLVQPEEVTMRKATAGGVTVMPDLSLVESRVDGRAMRYRPQRFTSRDVPVYDLTRGETLVEDAQSPTSSGGDQALVDPSGWTVLTVAPKPFASQSMGGVFHGVPRWSYPSVWPGLHASHEAPTPDRPGELIGTTRLLGGFVTPGRGDAGPLWAVNGNMGNMYLFTVDGLFVAELFRDIRQGTAWAMPRAQRGMLLNNVSLHDENFWPGITQTADGQVYLVDGGRTSIVRVDGLDQLHRLPESVLQVTKDDLRAAQSYLVQAESQRQRQQGRPTLHVALRKIAPTVDGKLDDWAAADWATIDRSGVAANFDSKSKPYDIAAAVAVAGERLYAAFRTGDPQLLANSGEIPLAPFKTGGCLDLMLAADPAAGDNRAAPVRGDVRLLVTLIAGKPRAWLYRPVVPGTPPGKAVPFSSPWRTITIDRVDDVSGDVQFAAAAGNFEFSIPLAALGLHPRPGQVYRGDVGVLRGNGFQTLHRVYWSNKATGITADVPSEATLEPQLWGRWVFDKE